jgi:YD repeat-containing protein
LGHYADSYASSFFQLKTRFTAYCLRVVLSLSLVIGWAGSANSQTATTPPAAPVRLPAAPNAAALERYALMPVNEAAGTPTISLPLYEVHSGSLALPLTLSYHASGVRVSDQASWVGLGWALNAGGVITRQVRGLPDEQLRGFYNNCRTVPRADTITIAKHGTMLQRVVDNQLDYQPDLYSYNLQGQAGSFMLGNDREFHCLPVQPVRIQWQEQDSSFLLTDAQGIAYQFAHQEKSHSTGRPPATIRYTSAWYLSRVVSADKADTIRLEYDAYSVSSTSLHQQHTLFVHGNVNLLTSAPTDTYSETQTITFQETWRLRRLLFRAGEVRFRTAPRADQPDDRRLVNITVLAPTQDTLKSVRLYQSYYDQERLRLDSIATTAPRLALPATRFTYNNTPLPDRLSGSRDHWGYYNGAPAVASLRLPATTSLLIPRLRISQSVNWTTVYPGADRAPNPAYVQAGLLTTIRYPTGGSQHFTYEPNTVAEQYPLPPIPLFPPRNLATTGPGPKSNTTGTCEDVTNTVSVTQAGTTLYYLLRGNRFTPFDGLHEQVALHLYTLASPQQLIYSKVYSFSAADPSLEVADSVALAPGDYQLVLESCGNTRARATITATYVPPGIVRTGWRNALAGGVRVRTLRLQASAQAPVTIKRYRYTTPGTPLSSGYTIGNSIPLYDRSHVRRVRQEAGYDDQTTPGGKIPPPVDLTFLTLSSSSLTELSGSDRAVGYRYVTVLDSTTTGQYNGYTVNYYRGVPDVSGGWKPARPLVSNAWQRDQLLEQRVYASLPNGPAQLLLLTQHDYVRRDSVRITSFTACTDADVQYEPIPNLAERDGLFKYAYANAWQTSRWQYLRQTRQYQYAPGDTTAYHLATTTYRYDNPRHQQPTLVETDLANGQHQQVRTRYVADYDGTQLTSQSPGPARAIRELQRLNAVAQVVEQTTTRTTPTDTLVTQSKLTLSRVLAPGVVVTDRELRYKTATPSRWRTFAPAALRAGQLTVAPGYETQLVCDAYTPQRALAQAHAPSGLPLSYLWNTRAQQPLAQVKNATLAQVAVTSFEPQAAGRWAYDTHLGSGQHLAASGRTGNWAYQLTSGWPISRDSLPAGDYELTCWYQGGPAPLVLGSGSTPVGTLQPLGPPIGTWQPARARVHLATAGRVQVSASGGTAVRLDDLCLYPVGAQLTTYTYDALRGVTSQTGPDGRTQTYEYDGLGRLVRTRDEQGRILGQQQYHYAGQ